jgi:membrane protein DedA with SNARE-associated domain
LTEEFLRWLGEAPTPLAYAVLILLSAVENVFPPVPADVAVALGAFFAQRSGHSTALLGFLCWLANTISSAGMYALARARGTEFFTRGWGRRLIPPVALDALRQAYARHGVVGIFFTRFLPGLRAGVTPFAGVVGLSPWRALVPSALASAIWYAAIVGLATAFGFEWPAVRRMIERANTTLAVIALAVAFAFWFLWRLRRRSA